MLEKIKILIFVLVGVFAIHFLLLFAYSFFPDFGKGLDQKSSGAGEIDVDQRWETFRDCYISEEFEFLTEQEKLDLFYLVKEKREERLGVNDVAPNG